MELLIVKHEQDKDEQERKLRLNGYDLNVHCDIFTYMKLQYI